MGLTSGKPPASSKGYGLYFKNHPGAREKVFLLSKTKSKDPETMVRDLDKTLETIGTSYIDLFVIHAVDRIECLDDQIRKVAERLKRGGKIRYFGFTTHSNMEQCLAGAAKLGWIDGIVTTYNYRLMHRNAMEQAVKSCAKAGIGLVAIKSQAAMAHPTATVGVETDTSLALAHRFMAKGFTLHQAKLKAIWENPLISSTFSMMPNTTILMANAAAAMDRTALSSGDMALLKTYANETLSCYCSGCAGICESVAPNHIPIAKVMRYLMYYHSYNDYEKARSCYHRLPIGIRQGIAGADYSIAELECPNRLAIGDLLRRASHELA
ncbi:MAG: aldo/keto reductase [Desulfobacterium sp.]|nr:aldo/keto reductase [Desulfobacterium sp.]